jgi:hypothetical protein
MIAHALLSPSSAERWLNCTPSAKLEEAVPGKSSQAADEGTLAHSLGELLIKQKMKWIGKKEFAQKLIAIETHKLYDHAMADYAESYAVFVMERFASAQAYTKDAAMFLEQKLNLTEFIPDGFGTGDCVVIADRILDITDLKYGKGVPVFAENNKQMMLYGLGALREFDYIYDIQIVRMTIYQPRLDSITSWELPIDELKNWAETELKPRAALAFKGEGKLVPGKHCRFCKINATCKANAEMNLEIAQYDFAESKTLSDKEIADILSRADAFTKWIGVVEEYALEQAINGKKWPGFKLVEGRSNRQYSDTTLVAEKLIGKGFSPDKIFTKSLLGITAMEKELGKPEFQANLSDLIIKPPGKPALVPDTDKRPEYNSADSAKLDFANN